MNKERASEPQRWLVAREYQAQGPALADFMTVRDMLLTDDLDVSVMRFSLDNKMYLALVGEEPLSAEAQAKINSVLDRNSLPATLPEDTAAYLKDRRSQFKRTGLEYLERRSQG